MINNELTSLTKREQSYFTHADIITITAHKLNSCVDLESSFFLPFLQLFERQVDQVAAEQSRKKKRTGGLKLSGLKTLQQILFDNKIIHVYFIPVQFM